MLRYIKNNSNTSGSLWNYYRDELIDVRNYPNSLNKNVINAKFFKNETSITGSTYNLDDDAINYDPDRSGKKYVQVVVPLKHLGSFWSGLDIALVNCQVSLTLTWSANCALTSKEKRLQKNICTRR